MATYEFVNLNPSGYPTRIKKLDGVNIHLTLNELEELERRFGFYLNKCITMQLNDPKKLVLMELSASIMIARSKVVNTNETTLYTLFLQLHHLVEIVNILTKTVKVYNIETISILTTSIDAIFSIHNIVNSD